MRKIIHTLYIGVTMCLIASPAMADFVHVTAGKKQLKGFFNDDGTAIVPEKRKTIKSVHVTSRVRGMGTLVAVLNAQTPMKVAEDQRFVTLQGEGFYRKKNGRNKSVPVALTVANDEGKLRLRLMSRNSSGRRKSVSSFEAEAYLGETGVRSPGRLRLARRSALKNEYCGTPHVHRDDEQPFNPQARVGIEATLKQATVTNWFDTEFEQREQSAGRNAGETSASVWNTVDSIYRRDLLATFSVNFDNTAKNISSVIQTNNNFEFDIHLEMKNIRTDSDDIFSLVTGKVPAESGLLGAVPDLGPLCRTPSNSIEFNIHDGNTTLLMETIAHETGHLFNMQHDDGKTGGTGGGTNYLMAASAGGITAEFSTFSKNEGTEHMNSTQGGSCLESVEGEGGGGSSTPTPTATPDPGTPGTGTGSGTNGLELFKRGGKSGKKCSGKGFIDLYDANNDGIDGVGVTIYCRASKRDEFEAKSVLTTEDGGWGRFKMRFKEQCYATATVDDELLTSNYIKRGSKKRCRR